jgi:hypothetical protein
MIGKKTVESYDEGGGVTFEVWRSDISSRARSAFSWHETRCDFSWKAIMAMAF